MSSRCGAICSIQIPTISLSNKEFACKLIFTHPEDHLHTCKTYAPSRSSPLRSGTCLTWKAQLAAYYSSHLRAHFTWSRTPQPISTAQL